MRKILVNFLNVFIVVMRCLEHFAAILITLGLLFNAWGAGFGGWVHTRDSFAAGPIILVLGSVSTCVEVMIFGPLLLGLRCNRSQWAFYLSCVLFTGAPILLAYDFQKKEYRIISGIVMQIALVIGIASAWFMKRNRHIVFCGFTFFAVLLDIGYALLAFAFPAVSTIVVFCFMVSGTVGLLIVFYIARLTGPREDLDGNYKAYPGSA